MNSKNEGVLNKLSFNLNSFPQFSLLFHLLLSSGLSLPPLLNCVTLLSPRGARHGTCIAAGSDYLDFSSELKPMEHAKVTHDNKIVETDILVIFACDIDSRPDTHHNPNMIFRPFFFSFRSGFFSLKSGFMDSSDTDSILRLLFMQRLKVMHGGNGLSRGFTFLLSFFLSGRCKN